MAKKTTPADVKNSVWLAELDRFGYDLRVIGRTEEEAVESLMKEYARAYKKINGTSPKRERGRYGHGSYYEEALGDVSVTEMPFGEVEWT